MTPEQIDGLNAEKDNILEAAGIEVARKDGEVLCYFISCIQGETGKSLRELRDMDPDERRKYGKEAYDFLVTHPAIATEENGLTQKEARANRFEHQSKLLKGYETHIKVDKYSNLSSMEGEERVLEENYTRMMSIYNMAYYNFKNVWDVNPDFVQVHGVEKLGHYAQTIAYPARMVDDAYDFIVESDKSINEKQLNENFYLAVLTEKIIKDRYALNPADFEGKSIAENETYFQMHNEAKRVMKKPFVRRFLDQQEFNFENPGKFVQGSDGRFFFQFNDEFLEQVNALDFTELDQSIEAIVDTETLEQKLTDRKNENYRLFVEGSSGILKDDLKTFNDSMKANNREYMFRRGLGFARDSKEFTNMMDSIKEVQDAMTAMERSKNPSLDGVESIRQKIEKALTDADTYLEKKARETNPSEYAKNRVNAVTQMKEALQDHMASYTNLIELDKQVIRDREEMQAKAATAEAPENAAPEMAEPDVAMPDAPEAPVESVEEVFVDAAHAPTIEDEPSNEPYERSEFANDYIKGLAKKVGTMQLLAGAANPNVQDFLVSAEQSLKALNKINQTGVISDPDQLANHIATVAVTELFMEKAAIIDKGQGPKMIEMFANSSWLKETLENGGISAVHRLCKREMMREVAIPHMSKDAMERTKADAPQQNQPVAENSKDKKVELGNVLG